MNPNHPLINSTCSILNMLTVSRRGEGVALQQFLIYAQTDIMIIDNTRRETAYELFKIISN